ncbi:type IV secretion system protein [Bartonella tribocorum]|uniref:type IV secretion system protein n=1 Tax=Bartonella tribocorum TaxID=85701 RepID=UPI00043B0678|nr:type IV secretion system protein [Bartonella tribocorum]CDO49828.1 TrwJ2 protein [Bartonella tribocorum]
MKKRFLITGMITLLAMLNLTLTSNFSWGSENQGSSLQAEYLQVINLLKQQIEENEKQIEGARKIYESIAGNKTQATTVKNQDLFLQHSHDIYPSPQIKYLQSMLKKHENYMYLVNIINSVNREEMMGALEKMAHQRIYEIINMRLKYNGIVEKAVSLQAFQDAEGRFTQIANFLNDINKTTDLREVFELQTRIRNMSSILQNEYAKLQMVRNLRDNEELLIDMQKRRLYGRIINSQLTSMPKVKL